jgi:hypothetical protein
VNNKRVNGIVSLSQGDVLSIAMNGSTFMYGNMKHEYDLCSGSRNYWLFSIASEFI